LKAAISPEPALLGFLLAGPLHGYDLYRRVNQELGPIWHLGMSQMYAIVGNYERQGWISTHVERQKTHPARKMLRLTPAGRQAFDSWLQQTAHGMRELRIDFFLRLYFARQAGPAQTRTLIDRQRQAIRRELALLQTARAATPREQNSFQWLAWDFRLHQLSTVLRWLDDHRSELGSSVPTASRARASRSVARWEEHSSRVKKSRKGYEK
jgi:PadR family transcriptional regulator AphA